MTDLLLEPTSRNEAFLAQEANKVNGFEIVAAAAVQGGVGFTGPGGETLNAPVVGFTDADTAPAGPVNLFKQKGFASLWWSPSPGPTTATANSQLESFYDAKFITARPDANYQVQVTLTYPSSATQGYGIVARIDDKTVDGFKYKLFMVPDGSIVSPTGPTGVLAANALTFLGTAPAGTNIPIYSTQFGHDVLIVDF